MNEVNLSDGSFAGTLDYFKRAKEAGKIKGGMIIYVSPNDLKKLSKKQDEDDTFCSDKCIFNQFCDGSFIACE